MAINNTTITGAISATVTQFAVASTTGITAPNFQTGSGITYLLVDQEYMQVSAVNTTTLVVQVVRGVLGSIAAAHTSGSLVQAGAPGDFGTPTEVVGISLTTQEVVGSMKSNAVFLTGSADALTGAPGIFVVKTAGVDAMTIPTPTATMEGNIVEVWSDTTNAHTITAASACVATGIALKTILTFTAFRGCGVRLRACNGTWQLIGGSGVATAANGGVVPS